MLNPLRSSLTCFTALVIVIGLFSACSSPNAEGETSEAGALYQPDTIQRYGSIKLQQKDYTTIKVFYATDRKQTGNAEPNHYYGGKRGALEYGTCEVSIPPGHQVGELEEPVWWQFEIYEDPQEHVVLMSLNPKPKNDFFTDMADFIGQREKKQAFIFVHGYNVTFQDAARRTAQIAHDLTFDGAPIMYSWPSVGMESAYLEDEANIEWTEPHLKSFLQDVAEQSGAQKINLIAHSMGNRALTKMFARLSEEQKQKLGNIFQEVILTAPDIDADIFKRDIAPNMLKSGAHITLYASSTDKALLLSKGFHGYVRAGDSGEGLLIIDGIETIDATIASTSFLGHSYFAESPDVISDIFDLLQLGIPAPKREKLFQKEEDRGRYWVFREKIDPR